MDYENIRSDCSLTSLYFVVFDESGLIKPKIKVNKDILYAMFAILFVVVLLYWFFPVIASSDVIYFEEVGVGVEKVVNGQNGIYRSIYPPLASLYFFVVHKSFATFSFAKTWAICLVLWLTGVCVYARWRLGSRDLWLFTVSIIITAFLLHPAVVFSRYDLIMVVPLFLGWRAYSYGRYGDSAFFLSVEMKLLGLRIGFLNFFY